MTPERLLAVMNELGWGVPKTAKELGVQSRSVERWLRGENEVPEPLAAWLERRVADPVPRREE